MSEVENNTTPEAVPAAPVAEAPTAVNLMDLVSEDHKALVEGKGFTDVNEVLKSYSHMEKLVGKSIRLPSEDSSPEARQEFYDKLKGLDNIIIKPEAEADQNEYYNKLGRPEAAEEYALQSLVDAELLAVAPGVTGEIDNFQKIAHDIGLNKKQAEALVSMRMADLKGITEERENTRTASETKLHEIWGQDYENRLVAAKNVAKIYSEKYPDAMSELIEGPSGNNPALLSMLAELGNNFKEKGHVGMQAAKFGTTPDEALDKIAEKKADKGFMSAYMDDRHPGHNKALKDLMHLYAIANGS